MAAAHDAVAARSMRINLVSIFGVIFCVWFLFFFPRFNILLILHNFHVCYCCCLAGFSPFIATIQRLLFDMAQWVGQKCTATVCFVTYIFFLHACVYVCVRFFIMFCWNENENENKRLFVVFSSIFGKLFEKLAFNWFVSCCAWVLRQEAANFFVCGFLLHSFFHMQNVKIVNFLN